MDEWRWEHLRPWLNARTELPVGPLFCIIDGPTRGRPWSGAAVRGEFRRLAARAGVRRRFAPHQLRHAHALELAREGVPLNIIQRQLGHANLGTTSIYLQGINPEEIIAAMRTRRAPDDVRQRRAPALNDSGGGSVTRRFRSAMPKRVPVRHWSRRSCLVHGGRAGLDRRTRPLASEPGSGGVSRLTPLTGHCIELVLRDTSRAWSGITEWRFESSSAHEKSPAQQGLSRSYEPETQQASGCETRPPAAGSGSRAGMSCPHADAPDGAG